MERYLMHYGVQGQKWGVRKYQNPDGTLTPLGRQHYGLNELDYGSKYKGTYGAGRKAYKKERKQLMDRLAEGKSSMRSELSSEYEAKRSAAKNLTEAEGIDNDYKKQDSIIDRTYQKGQKEVDRYLKGKYGETIINGKKLTQKQKDAIVTGSLCAVAALGAIGYLGGKEYVKTNKENNVRRNSLKSELDKMNKAMDDTDAWRKSGYKGFNIGAMNRDIHKTGANIHKTNLDKYGKGWYKRGVDKDLNTYYKDTMDRYSMQKEGAPKDENEKIVYNAHRDVTSIDRNKLNKNKRFS